MSGFCLISQILLNNLNIMKMSIKEKKKKKKNSIIDAFICYSNIQ